MCTRRVDVGYSSDNLHFSYHSSNVFIEFSPAAKG